MMYGLRRERGGNVLKRVEGLLEADVAAYWIQVDGGRSILGRLRLDGSLEVEVLEDDMSLVEELVHCYPELRDGMALVVDLLRDLILTTSSDSAFWLLRRLYPDLISRRR